MQEAVLILVLVEDSLRGVYKELCRLYAIES